jgi:hypothetical protein
MQHLLFHTVHNNFDVIYYVFSCELLNCVVHIRDGVILSVVLLKLDLFVTI